jgi:hypothetical protein
MLDYAAAAMRAKRTCCACGRVYNAESVQRDPGWEPTHPVEDRGVDIAEPALERGTQRRAPAALPGKAEEHVFERGLTKARDDVPGLGESSGALHELGPGLGVALDPGEVSVEAFGELLERSAMSVGFDSALQLAGVLLDGGFEELDLIGEVVVEQRLGNAGGLGDLTHMGRSVLSVPGPGRLQPQRGGGSFAFAGAM